VRILPTTFADREKEEIEQMSKKKTKWGNFVEKVKSFSKRMKYAAQGVAVPPERVKVGKLAVDKVLASIKKHDYPLLFVHGAGGTSAYLKNYLDFFSEAGWDCYAINLRGHGPSDPVLKLTNVTIDDYIADVKTVIKSLEISNTVLIGHSMGGLIVQKTAESVNTVKAMIAIASAPPAGVRIQTTKDPRFIFGAVKTLWNFMKQRPAAPNFRSAKKTVLNNIDKEDRRAIFAMIVPESVAAGLQVAAGVPLDVDKIKCPKLVIGCKLDNMALEPMERKLADHLKADYISYDQFAHMIMVEKGWQQSAKDIQAWLEKNVRKDA
jgi:pimeloyl-ACP methyl ester carboxylesterase